MSKKGLEWTPKQVEIAGLLRVGANRQAIISKDYSKTMASRVVNTIKTELKQPETKPEQT